MATAAEKEKLVQLLFLRYYATQLYPLEGENRES